MSDLFQKEIAVDLDASSGLAGNKRPLSDILRPSKISQVVGQSHLTGDGEVLDSFIHSDFLPSFILWGPPGCGKTTLARLIVNQANEAQNQNNYQFEEISAIFSGVADLKKVFAKADQIKSLGQQMVLFVDEIHRFNKAQQDSFLPYIEKGSIVLIGATTENPSFNLNNALLSRCRILVLKALDEEALIQLYQKVENYYERKIPLNEQARESLIRLSAGDGRYLLNRLEEIMALKLDEGTALSVDDLEKKFGNKVALYDRDGDQHYNLISALHKSIRGSDPDAALYWFCRMLAGGEDPLYLGRRLVRMAGEDIGLADPQAMPVVEASVKAYERLGSPEGELSLANAVVYLATAPKSNAVYKAYKMMREQAKKTSHLNPPKHILNAPTKVMKDQDYGKGYIYDHDTEHAFSGQDYFPEEMGRVKFYNPVPRGFEREIEKRLSYWEKLRFDKSKS